MISFSNSQRSTQPEIMDDFDLQGAEMELLLTDLKKVNKLLGGNAITVNGIKKLIQTTNKTSIVIVDVGCGDGELLRQCAKHIRKTKYNCTFLGVDANNHILETARNRSLDYPEINYRVVNVFAEEIKSINADIFLCTLFLHHFDNEKIKLILTNLMQQASVGVVINDLHRSKIAFKLFKVFSTIFIKTKIARHDGLVSVARGFKKKELENIAENIPASQHIIKWKWAFRFQWILKK